MSQIDSAVFVSQSLAGFMQPYELYWLATQASFRNTVIEVGSWKGKSTKAIAATCPGTVYAVDHWQGAPGERAKSQSEVVTLGPDGVFEIFKATLRTEIDSGKVIPVRYESGEAAEFLKMILGHGCADLVFIDGDHEYEAVKRDIKLWLPFVAPGGMICGHDYYDAPDVKRAVTELFPEHVEGPIWSYAA